jgi:hypothetical protein
MAQAAAALVTVERAAAEIAMLAMQQPDDLSLASRLMMQVGPTPRPTPSEQLGSSSVVPGRPLPIPDPSQGSQGPSGEGPGRPQSISLRLTSDTGSASAVQPRCTRLRRPPQLGW